VAKVRYSGMFGNPGNASEKSGTLAGRISTGEAQEMQKNSRPSLVVSLERWLADGWWLMAGGSWMVAIGR
jgi:hypothetical protein